MSDNGVSRRRVMQGIGAGTAGLVAGCLGGDDEEDDEVHILTDFTGDEWEPYWEDDLVPGFEAEHDIPINVEYAGFQGTGEQRLATLMQAQDAPEIYHATTPELGDLINQGLTMSVDDVVEDLVDQWGDPLYEYTLQPLPDDQDDEYHWIPHGVYVGGCLNYRADVYAALELEVPETWDELVENARIIDEADGPFEDTRGFALPAVAAGKSGSDFSNWLYNSGGDVWQDDGDGIEVWFDEEHVMPVLEVLQELAQYSPDPSSVDWGTTIEYWMSNRIGQCFMNNAWLCGPTYMTGLAEESEPLQDIALQTEQALIPTREGAEPLTRGWVLVNGTPIIDGSSNPEGAKEFKRYMYGEDRHVEVSLMEPMRFIPPYESIMESDEYQSADIFQIEDGAFLEKNQFVLDEIVPELESPELPAGPETLHVNTFGIDSEMTNRLIVEEQDPDDVYEWGYDEFQSRYEDVQAQSNY